MKYVSKPVEIEAIQWTGANNFDVRDFIQSHDTAALIRFRGGFDPTAGALWVGASQAWCDINEGDFIIAERNGPGVYPCRREDFEQRYEAKP